MPSTPRSKLSFILKIVGATMYVFSFYYYFIYPLTWLTYVILNAAIGNFFFAIAFRVVQKNVVQVDMNKYGKTIEEGIKMKIYDAINRFQTTIEIEEPAIVNVDGIPVKVRFKQRRIAEDQAEEGQRFKPISPAEG